MLDFTSVLYLGFHHASHTLPCWTQFTVGVPAAMAEPPTATAVARRIADLVGCEQSIVGPSTLHLVWDLFTMLASYPITIYLDDGAYPIARWGVERASAFGVNVRAFAHHDADALARMVRRKPEGRPVIVSDGVCTGCGCSAPLAAYHEIARRYGGLLVVDDTQALGLLGTAPDRLTPYGHGGGGSLRRHGLSGPDIILVSSLAKSFGAPLAALCGSKMTVGHFRRNSDTRVHCSPPSLPALLAAKRALAMNDIDGENRRRRLARRVFEFRGRLASEGLRTSGGMFPIQTLSLPAEVDAPGFHRLLSMKGLRSVLRRGCDGRPAVSLAITARHHSHDIERAADIVTRSYATLGAVRKGTNYGI